MATELHIRRPLSEGMADLSQRAKAAEDAFEAARAETKQKLDAFSPMPLSPRNVHASRAANS